MRIKLTEKPKNAKIQKQSRSDSQAVADYLDKKSAEYEQQRVLWEESERMKQTLAKPLKK